MKPNKTNEQLMQQDEIYELVATQLSDTLTADESRRLNEWIEANREEYNRLVKVWQSTPDVSELSQYDSKKAFALFVNRIQTSGEKPTVSEPAVEQPKAKPTGKRRYVISFTPVRDKK